MVQKTPEETAVARNVTSMFEEKAKTPAIIIPSVTPEPTQNRNEFGVNTPTTEVPTNTKNPTEVPAMKIETVQYDDGKYSANAEINKDGNTTTIPFLDTFKTKEEAVQSVVDKVKNLPESESLKPILNRDIHELLSEYHMLTTFGEDIHSSFTPEEIQAIKDHENNITSRQVQVVEDRKGTIRKEYEKSDQSISYDQFAENKLKEINDIYAQKMGEISTEINISEP